MSDDANVFARFRFGSSATSSSKRARDASNGSSASSNEPQPPLSSSGRSGADASPSAVKKRRDAALAADTALPLEGAPASAPRSKWQERWHGICDACFAAAVKCTHHDEHLLRLLIVGHNPSDHAWQSGYSYSNPTNRMWSLIVGRLAPLSWRGILPADTPVAMQNAMPYLYGVGFTSIGLEHASMNRDGSAICSRPHGPLLIAFSGKRQFSYLFSPPLAKVESYGPQTRLPQDWPYDCVPESEVWVLPSSSGRSALTHEERSTPYRQLADRLHTIPWPFDTNVVDSDALALDAIVKPEPIKHEAA